MSIPQKNQGGTFWEINPSRVFFHPSYLHSSFGVFVYVASRLCSVQFSLLEFFERSLVGRPGSKNMED